MMARSNSANTPIIWNTALPLGVLVSRVDLERVNIGQERNQVLQ
jgi:hypothetical protein